MGCGRRERIPWEGAYKEGSNEHHVDQRQQSCYRPSSDDNQTPDIVGAHDGTHETLIGKTRISKMHHDIITCVNELMVSLAQATTSYLPGNDPILPDREQTSIQKQCVGEIDRNPHAP